jgi:hypothetical protein
MKIAVLACLMLTGCTAHAPVRSVAPDDLSASRCPPTYTLKDGRCVKVGGQP